MAADVMTNALRPLKFKYRIKLFGMEYWDAANHQISRKKCYGTRKIDWKWLTMIGH